jgi:hypothetical protein
MYLSKIFTNDEEVPITLPGHLAQTKCVLRITDVIVLSRNKDGGFAQLLCSAIEPQDTHLGFQQLLSPLYLKSLGFAAFSRASFVIGPTREIQCKIKGNGAFKVLVRFLIEPLETPKSI